MAHAPDQLMTADDLLALGDIGRAELINGELVRMSPAGFGHGRIAMRIARLLANHVEENALGIAVAAETGFLIRRNPDTVRAPDAAFISNDRLPDPLPDRGFFPGAPDFAVEVVSPEDTWSDVASKARDWLAAGTQLVWVVDPKTQTITAYTPTETATIGRDEIASADPVVRGLKIVASDIFR